MSKKLYTPESLARGLTLHGVQFIAPEPGRPYWLVRTGLGDRKWTDREVHGYCHGRADAKRHLESISRAGP